MHRNRSSRFVDEPGRHARVDSEPDRRYEPGEGLEAVRLTKKFADEIDGISLAGKHVGERLVLSHADAHLLVVEGWAEPVPASEQRNDTQPVSRATRRIA